MPLLAELGWRASSQKYIGKDATGFVFYVSDAIATDNFTEFYREKLKADPDKLFKIPIGKRERPHKPLPQSFPKIEKSCLLTSTGPTSRCCVGYGLAAAMAASGDREWAHIRDLAVAAVFSAESSEDDVETEQDYFKRYFQLNKQRLYTHRVFTSSFHHSMLDPDDIAVCQVTLCTFTYADSHMTCLLTYRPSS